MFKMLVDTYLEHFPNERGKLQLLLDQLAEQGEAALASRQHFDSGHVTASALVVHLASRQIVLVKHSTLRRWIQPGGHLEPTDSDPLQAATREVAEETGLQQLHYLPLDIDIHAIPAVPHKHEPPHYHYDFRYLLAAVGQTLPPLHPAGIDNARWEPWATFMQLEEFAVTADKIQQLLERSS